MLRLSALDTEDLSIISAHMQDAVVRLGDIAYNRARRQFAFLANRFAWEEQGARQRHRAGLHFDRVLKVQAQNIHLGEKDVILSLLSVGFTERDAPSGDILLTFSGGGTIRLEVECIEVQLKDLGPVWSTPSRPSHPEDGEFP
jgi:hypothetical protein